MPLVPLASEGESPGAGGSWIGFPCRWKSAPSVRHLIFGQCDKDWKISSKTVPTPTTKSPEELLCGLHSNQGQPRRDGRGVKPGHRFHSTSPGSIRRLFAGEASGKFTSLKLSSVA